MCIHVIMYDIFKYFVFRYCLFILSLGLGQLHTVPLLLPRYRVERFLRRKKRAHKSFLLSTNSSHLTTKSSHLRNNSSRLTSKSSHLQNNSFPPCTPDLYILIYIHNLNYFYVLCIGLNDVSIILRIVYLSSFAVNPTTANSGGVSVQ